jgi:hypothetical protein
MGLGGAMREPLTGPTRMSIMPPRIGYPFYQPAGFLTPSVMVSGMSM